MVAPEWGGLVKFDGESWTVCDTTNSELPHNYVRSLAADSQGNIWIGTIAGLSRFDGEKWTVYNADNSDIPNNIVNALAEDPQGNIWIGTNGGLARLDGENWIVYHTWDSELPDVVSSLTIDSQGDIWIGTWNEGLAKFDGGSWTVYDTDNSGLPNNNVRSLAIDSHGNLWIGTWGGGLGVYREGGVMLPGGITAVGEEFHTKLPSAFTLSQNFPNPFNPSTSIRFSVPEMHRGAQHVELTIYDLLGQKVRTLMEGHVGAGVIEATWDGKDEVGREVSSGVYFYKLVIDDGKWTETRKMVLLR
jgi:sugar lactone lactonase YvrE